MSVSEKAAAIISGGSRGIGLEIAKAFARNSNHPIVLLARDLQQLGRARAECLEAGAAEVHILSVDVSDAARVNDIELPDGLQPGILVNNAGLFLKKFSSETSREEFKSQFEINTASAFYLSQKFLPQLKLLPRAFIVNICSVAGIRGYGDAGAYTMSKHALVGYTRALRKELECSNIAVTAVHLGQTWSSSWDGIEVNPELLINPEDLGRLVWFMSTLSKQSVVEEITIMPQHGEI